VSGDGYEESLKNLTTACGENDSLFVIEVVTVIQGLLTRPSMSSYSAVTVGSVVLGWNSGIREVGFVNGESCR
jgi:hypothetical protein